MSNNMFFGQNSGVGATRLGNPGSATGGGSKEATGYSLFKKNSRKIWPLEVSTEIRIRYRLSPLHYPISRSATGKCKRGILLKSINDCTIHKYRLLKH